MGDDKPKVKINEAARTVASFINLYRVWTDGYPDSAACAWDMTVRRYQDSGQLKAAINSIEASLGDGSEEMKALELTGDVSVYREMLTHMKISV